MKAFRLALVLSMAAASGLAVAHHGRLQDHMLRGDILHYGIYAPASDAFLRRVGHAPGAPAGVALVEQTTILPAAAGVHFGFCARISGALADGDLDLVKVVAHPPQFRPDGSVSTGYEQEVELTAAGGEALACVGHTVEDVADTAPGRWTIALMAADQVVAAKTFELR